MKNKKRPIHSFLNTRVVDFVKEKFEIIAIIIISASVSSATSVALITQIDTPWYEVGISWNLAVNALIISFLSLFSISVLLLIVIVLVALAESAIQAYKN